MKEINMTDKKEQPIKVEPKKEESIETKTLINSKEDVEVQQPVESKNDEMTKKVNEKISSEKISKKKSILILSGIGLLLVLGIAAFYYFGIYKYHPTQKDENIVTVNTNYILSAAKAQTFAQVLVDSPQEPRTEESPINGLLFTKSEMEELMNRRPVAVMINNHAAARPQSSVSSADIVYETLAEGGITRYMAIFWSQGVEKVGPIRSARQYFLEWLSPYDAIYIHDGCAGTDNPLTDACGNIYAYNIKDISTIGSWRWDDGVRYAPHNEYSSVTNAWEYAETRGWDSFPDDFESWQFKNDDDLDQRGDAYRYKIVFHSRLNNGGAYDVIWQYDKTTNSYKRWVGGEVDIDQENNTQITSKVVIVQEVEMTPAYDNKSRIIQETIGTGDAIILMDGNEINGSWKKTSRTDRTTFYDSSGNEIEFNRGKIWIEAVAQSVGEFDIIEQ
ncbi:MAG: DUF3048 domain-containing protein [Candidatus Dojkabacteria bacterium]|nr:DUF3048 domain-containing protein [Candidatus Dojkabacteria bacterium]